MVYFDVEESTLNMDMPEFPNRSRAVDAEPPWSPKAVSNNTEHRPADSEHQIFVQKVFTQPKSTGKSGRSYSAAAPSAPCAAAETPAFWRPAPF